MLTNEGIILDANEAFSKRFGKTPIELIGVDAWSLIPGKIGELRKTYLAKVIASRKPVRFEDERLGTWFSNTLYPILDEQGNVANVVIVARDITEQKQAETQIRQSHKMEALGTLAGGVAHDFNNILASILGNTELFMLELPNGAKGKHYLENILQMVSRAANLVK